ncbi:hypothetical protein PanWU01x14_195860 [Parasponia andersonii]|uniref:Uncharacterized protein n=1 Tax=Parasponia andersonii TaxID=3476 RepID=A0A2P5BZX4_PARAD|nr:hypothetical protein PanWU01x14_195860 [Parasponia andersonii]
MPTQRRSEAKAKSVGRRALRDVSNHNNGGGRAITTQFTKKEEEEEEEEEEKGRPTTTRAQLQQQHQDQDRDDDDDDALDRLLLVQSDLSALIDELVVQVFKFESKSKQGRKEVESFALVLSEMVSSLKPWVPRFQNVLSSASLESLNQSRNSLVCEAVSAVNDDKDEVVQSPERANMNNLLISPSPLVSWRANCTIERGRQLFLLTPVPRSKALSSTHPEPPKSLFERVTSDASKKLPCFNSVAIVKNHDLFEGVEIEPTPAKPSDLAATETSRIKEGGSDSPQMFSKANRSVVVMTPCLKRSPPKSCVLLEAITESFYAGRNVAFRRSTPFPVGLENYSDSESSSSSEASEGLALKYPELLGIQYAYKSGVTKKDVEESPDWFRSPPKTCVLLEPSYDQTLDDDTAATGTNCHLPLPLTTGPAQNNQMNVTVSKYIDSQDGGQQAKTTRLPAEPLDGKFSLIESTPSWKEPQSTSRRGKLPGENTLKKELWTKFEAASTNGLRFNVSVVEETSRKGFLDRLEEVSSDGEI